MLSIDLNCDMGEGYGNDEHIMPYISSANIACGLHAGDDDTIRRTIDLALQHNVAIGAHPSFNDRINFGRNEMHPGDTALHDLIASQVLHMKQLAQAAGAVLHHVKPHGALYNMAAKDAMMSRVIANAVQDIDAQLILYGLSNSQLITEAGKIGLRTASEVFADRTYTDQGSLTPRSHPGALIEDETQSVQQVLGMVLHGHVTSASGRQVMVKADTLCIHGDGIHAPRFAQRICQMLKQNNIEIKTI